MTSLLRMSFVTAEHRLDLENGEGRGMPKDQFSSFGSVACYLGCLFGQSSRFNW